jgi:hypothetical protein
MAVWSIQIVSGGKPGDPATFVAQNQPTAPVGTLYADGGDAVSWDNTTTQNHQPSLLPAPLLPVTPGHQTTAWIVTGTVGANVPYTCLLHPEEQGTIVVTG